MSFWSRIALFFRIKANTALDRIEDPRQTLDYAYSQQQELLRKVKLGLIEVATSKRQLEQQAQKLRARIPQLDEQARRALAVGREDLARLALQRKQTALTEGESLDYQIAEVAAEEHKLMQAEQQLRARLDEFRTRREVLAARHTAAQAQVRVGESLSGVTGELAELSMALERAEQKTEHMQARAAAIDDWVDASLSETQSLPIGDRVDRQLMQFDLTQAVEEQLAVLKRQLSTPTNGNFQNEGNER
jgi:phage shock protein A